MTTVAVWYIKEIDEMWGCADTRVSGGGTTLTDNAAKILPLQLQWSAPDDAGGWKVAGKAKLGLAYAGGVLPALLTHAAMNVFLQNLGSVEGHAPSLMDVAKLCAFLSKRYLDGMGAKDDSSIQSEYIIYGMCPSAGEFDAVHVAIDEEQVSKGKFEHALSRIDILNGSMGLLGEDVEYLRDRIETRRKVPARGRPDAGVEAVGAIKHRVSADWFEAVGGTLQFGIASRTAFTLQGYAYDMSGEAGAMQYLGFSLAEEIEPQIGQFITIFGRI